MQKFYTDAPACAPKNQQNFVASVAFSSGEAMPADPVGIPLGTHYEISGRFRVEGQREEAGTASCEGADAPGSGAFRRERYALQSRARSWLGGTKNPRGKTWRTCNCLRSINQNTGGVDILRSLEFGTAKFSGLQVCGSVWNCPICSAKVSEHRRSEVEAALDLHIDAGGKALMLTLTHPHQRSDDLRLMVELFRKAHSSMLGSRAYKQLAVRLGVIGRIKALEVTWGPSNGWHPHDHEVLLTDGFADSDVPGFELEISIMWMAACVRVGLPMPSATYGVDLKIAFSPAEYLAKFGHDTKWGSGRELTKAHIKKAGDGARYTPFDLLRAGTALPEAPVLWREYAEAYYGARQLSWSRGLKAAMCVVEVKDEVIAAGQCDQTHEFLCRIATQDWRRFLRAPRDMRPRLLEAAETGGWSAVSALLKQVLKEASAKLPLSSPSGPALCGPG